MWDAFLSFSIKQFVLIVLVTGNNFAVISQLNEETNLQWVSMVNRNWPVLKLASICKINSINLSVPAAEVRHFAVLVYT